MESIYNELTKYQESDYYPFHMPGHKRNMERYPMHEFYKIDITEIEGFDDLHHAEGILQRSMERAARLYHSSETFFLINGSTGGILSAISAVVQKHGKILMVRNSHKSAYNAVMLRELEPVFLYPQLVGGYGIAGGIGAEDVEKALENNKGIEAVFITSPTYEGIISDVEGIAEVVHGWRIPLIVDEAHGAHFGLYEGFPVNSVSAGADIVITSVHKTLPALTQTALLHVNGNLADRKMLRKYLSVYQSSSPSYILLSSLDACISILEQQGGELFGRFAARLTLFYKVCGSLKKLRVLGGTNGRREGGLCHDPGRVVISVQNVRMNGEELSSLLLEKYHLQMEMAAPSYVVAILTIMDKPEGLNRLINALLEIDREAEVKENDGFCWEEFSFPAGENSGGMQIWEAERQESEDVPLADSLGRMAADFIYLYPPGIPLLVPGEIIEDGLWGFMAGCLEAGFRLRGLTNGSPGRINVVKMGRMKIKCPLSG